MGREEAREKELERQMKWGRPWDRERERWSGCERVGERERKEGEGSI